MAKDYYETLGINKSASKDEIKKAYKKLAKKYHPDLNSEAGATDKFKEINEAASVLTDETKRSNYDQFGSADSRSNGFNGFQGGQGGFDFGDIFGEMFEGFGGGNRRRGPRRGHDLSYEMEVELEDVVNGGEREIVIPRLETCSKCKGTGAEKPSDVETCKKCGGSGAINVVRRTPFGTFQTKSACDACQGRGKTIKHYCSMCDGAGRIENHKKIKIEIPKGINSGVTLRMSGQGEAGEREAPPGDLLITIYIKKHKIFDREENDLYIEVPISFIDATIGGEIKVPTVNSEAKLKIPTGTQSNTLFKMKDLGVPYFRSSRIGNQYVKTVVYTPKSLNKKQKDLLKKFENSMKEKMNPEKGFFDKIKERFS